MTDWPRAVLFLDRDGTLMEDVGYPHDPAQVRLIPRAATMMEYLVECGFEPVVVSNQSGLARGLITPAQAKAVHERFVELFTDECPAEPSVVLPCFYCPHGPDNGCDCRKPAPGLLLLAVRELGLGGLPGIMVGDKPSDVEAGRNAGYDGLLFAGDWMETGAKLVHWLSEKRRA